VDVVADSAEARHVLLQVESLEAVLLGKDHLRDVVLVADRLEELPDRHVLRLGPGRPVLLGRSPPLLLDVGVLVVGRAVWSAVLVRLVSFSVVAAVRWQPTGDGLLAAGL